MPANEEEQIRHKTVTCYQYLCLCQFLLSVGLLVCGGLAVRFTDGQTSSFPYYVAAFCVGSVLLIACLLAFRVCNNGPSFSSTEEAKEDVLCGIRWHRALSMCLALTCVLGLAVAWNFGICFEEEPCYEENYTENRTLAIVIFVQCFVAGITAGCGVYIVRAYGHAFGIVFSRGILFGLGPPDPESEASGGGRNDGRSDRRQSGRDGDGGGAPDYLHQLHQQNEILQQQVERQNQHNAQFFPYTPPTTTGAYTNMAFTLPELPPYSPTPEGVSINPSDPSSASAAPPNTTYIAQMIPSDPPPPYTEVSTTKDL